MLFPQSMQLMQDGKPKVRRFERDSFGRTKRVQAYVTFGSNCNSQCGFCRNKSFSGELMKDNYTQLSETLEKYSPYIHTIVFGGGEPLLYADELYELMSNNSVLYNDMNSYIITNGSRELFFRKLESCKFCKKLSGVMLSRHHYDDSKNSEVFRNSHLLTEYDIENELCSALRNKLEFVTTCSKGYIDSVNEILNFIEWGKMLGINKFLFNDLQKDVTALKYWNENQIDTSVFIDSEDKLIFQGYNVDIFVCFTAGYDITTYSKGDIRVGFKRYHQSLKETIEKWKNSIKYTFDLSIMPNGEIFTDWTNQHKI